MIARALRRRVSAESGGADLFDASADVLDTFALTAAREDAARDDMHFCDVVYAEVNQILLQMHCGCGGGDHGPAAE